jgi:excisionase family DNA binding protein
MSISNIAEEHMMTNDNRLAYSPQEAADLMGLCLNTVYSLIKAGKLPSIKINRRLLIPRAGLEDLLKVKIANLAAVKSESAKN